MNGTVKNDGLYFQLIEGAPNDIEFNTLLNLYESIFADAKPDFFRRRLHEKNHVLAIIAFINEKAIGFKIGYEYNRDTFYSWVGGVLENNRKQGIARQLCIYQEKWAKNKSYSKLRTKSMNQFKPMMILNLKNGFEITEVYTNDSKQTKIVFEKRI